MVDAPPQPSAKDDAKSQTSDLERPFPKDLNGMTDLNLDTSHKEGVTKEMVDETIEPENPPDYLSGVKLFLVIIALLLSMFLVSILVNDNLTLPVSSRQMLTVAQVALDMVGKVWSKNPMSSYRVIMIDDCRNCYSTNYRPIPQLGPSGLVRLCLLPDTGFFLVNLGQGIQILPVESYFHDFCGHL